MSETSTTSCNSEEERGSAISRLFKSKYPQFVALISIVAIALGGLNDTIDVVRKVQDIVLSKFTDIPSHRKLNKVYVGASSKSLDEIYGAPVYIKKKATGNLIKYYQDNRYIISSIERGGAIAAYLVFPKKGFEPRTTEHSGGEDLFSHTLAYQDPVNRFSANISRTNSYYIEENAYGEFSSLYYSISGFSSFLSPTTKDNQARLKKLADDQIFGFDTTESVRRVRENLAPNFYGYSILDIGALEDAILSNTEYKLLNKQ
ncbi:ETEC_3214 domain-containing protein [Vibrio breoganii]|uniref:ETEC_3214 domain-containing protein n=1 Tax=Vibrio breoganii TaxID=553239 RepID=UPI0002D2EF1E|nr:ETEC_3214 domain-containing protein [Vibrio breoganii]